MTMRLAYHGTPKKYFESLDPCEPYVPEPFAREGFIHTTEGREAVSITLTKYYKSSAEPWVVLVHRSGPRDVADPLRRSRRSVSAHLRPAQS